MSRVLYTAQAQVTGGRVDGHAATSDGEVALDLRLPPELGGPGGGANPEQLFAIGYAACLEAAVGAVGRRLRVDPGHVAVDSRVNLLGTDGGGFGLAVELHVSLPAVEDTEDAKRLVAAAHRVCPYSNATRGNIDVVLTANGEPLDEPAVDEVP